MSGWKDKQLKNNILYGQDFDQMKQNEPKQIQKNKNQRYSLFEQNITQKYKGKKTLGTLLTFFFPKIKTQNEQFDTSNNENKYIISLQNKKKQVWNLLIMLLISYSVVTTSYMYQKYFQIYLFNSVAFDITPLKNFNIINIIIEVLFCIDIVLSFFSSYQDQKNQEITDLKLIVKHYSYGWFIIDLIGILPFFLGFSGISQSLAIRLVRFLRLPRILKLFSINTMNQILEGIFANAPLQDKIRKIYIIKYFYKILRLLLIALVITYFLAIFWYLYISQCQENNADCFYQIYNLEQYPKFQRLLLCSYFILTTLSTVGYGDYVPISNNEKLFGIVVMIIGIAFFSYILASFTDALGNYDKQMGIVNFERELQIWLAQINSVCQIPLDKQELNDIANHFKYFWKSNRLPGINRNDFYFNMISQKKQQEMIKHLFSDIFFNQFRQFFKLKNIDEQFYVDIAFTLLSRTFKKSYIIIKPGQQFQHVYFVVQGSIAVSKFIQTFDENKEEKVSKYFGSSFIFGDYQIIYSQISEFQYQCKENSKLLVIPKQNLVRILQQYPEVEKQLKDMTKINYYQTRKSMMGSRAVSELASSKIEGQRKIQLENDKQNKINILTGLVNQIDSIYKQIDKISNNNF